MSVLDWSGLILTTLSIVGIVATALRKYIDSQTEPVKQEMIFIKEVIEDVRKETKTNGGSSMRDEIKSIKREQEDAREKRKAQTEKIDHLYDLFVEYVSRNSK